MNDLIRLAPVSGERASPPEKEVRDRFVLLTKDNYDEIGYHPDLHPRELPQPVPDLPSRLKTTLHPHQKEGLAWLQTAWREGQPGVLLADDMGLGKTLQALAFLAWLQEYSGSWSKRFLIVAPTGLLENWRKEQQQHLHEPGLGEICPAYGSGLARLRSDDTVNGQKSSIPSLDVDRIMTADWVLTTYDTLADYHQSFGKVPFSVAILDEIQQIKNPATLRKQGVKALNIDFVIGLTGTPVENRLEDLWSIMDRVAPGHLMDLKSFCKSYRPEDIQTVRNLGEKLLKPDRGRRTPLVLRRIKAERLKGLPEKIEHKPEREVMHDLQAQLYREAVRNARNGQRGTALVTLHRLRGISLHPIDPATWDASCSPEKRIEESARLRATFRILDHIEAKCEKVLVFTEDIDMQRQLSGLIKARFKLPEFPLTISGNDPGKTRQRKVEKFQSLPPGFAAMIISPKAGGVGLNLTAANHVIHLSRWWNPAVEDQSTDRVYRIGQNKPVHVYIPMAVHPDYPESSFDVVLHDLLDRKRKLSREVYFMPPEGDSDVSALFDKVIGSKQSPLPKEDIDLLSPQNFEAWVLDRLKKHGWLVTRTATSGDGGADGIASHPNGGELIVQCKHFVDGSSGGLCGEKAIDDLLRAREVYNRPKATLIAVTNAPRFTDVAVDRAARHGIVLVSRERLDAWPLGCL